jgi:catechol 2,3-dioxygenase-like lactoylglutathione lyase family enzyme
MSCLDHVSCNVSDYETSKRFYEAALAPLGIRILMDLGVVCGFGRDKPDFWIASQPASFQRAEHLKHISPTHLAFAAKDRAQVDAFHQAALAAGGKDFGKPGVREQYHPNYYGAFVLDPDGNNVEAVCHGP